MIRYYLIGFVRGKNGAYKYPPQVSATVWKSVVYDAAQRTMVGATDAALDADRKSITALTPEAAQLLMKKYRAARPKAQREIPAALLAAVAPRRQRRK